MFTLQNARLLTHYLCCSCTLINFSHCTRPSSQWQVDRIGSGGDHVIIVVIAIIVVDAAVDVVASSAIVR
jgi:hypothetical protein